MTNFYRSAKLMFMIGTAFALSRGAMHEALADYYDPCEEPYEEEPYYPDLYSESIISVKIYEDDDDDDDCFTDEDRDAFEAGYYHTNQHPGHVGRHIGGQTNGGGPQTAGAVELFDNVTLSLDAQVSELYDELLGGDGNDYNLTLWLDSYYGPWTYGLGLTYDYYRVHDRYRVAVETYAADIYLMYNVVDNLHIGGFFDISLVDTHDATFSYGLGTATIGGEEVYYGAGILAVYNLSYDVYEFNFTTMVASMLKDDLGDIFDDEETQWNSSASVYRPLTDQLAAEAYVGWTYYFDRISSRDESYGNVGGNLIYSITDAWTGSFGVETDFAQEGYEALYLNVGVSYAW